MAYQGVNYSLLLAGFSGAYTFTQFWCNIGKAEDGVLISYLIFLILYLGFEIFTLLIHNKIVRLKIEGLLYHIVVGLDLFFLIMFYRYITLVAYLFFYSLIVSTISPLIIDYDDEKAPREKTFFEEEWDNHKAISIVNSVIILLL